MRARGYNKQIELWQTTKVSDGFGGNGVTNELITRTWCNIKTPLNGSYRTTEEGVTDTFNSLIITLRKRNDVVYNSLNLFFKYRGDKYIINSEPINVGFEDREIQIMIIKENVYEANAISPIGGSVFPYTFNFQLI